MTIQSIASRLEQLAPSPLQEPYDNAGLICGDPQHACTGILCALDATESVIEEAIAKQCNLVVAHHPIVFSALKKFSATHYVQRALVKALKHDIAIYAIHTNLDNVQQGVNWQLASKLSMRMDSLRVLDPKTGILQKLYTYVPVKDVEMVRQALFEAGAGHVGQYSECSFGSSGFGTFRPSDNTQPHIGTPGGPREMVEEVKVEVIMPAYLSARVLTALKRAHPYEEVAYGIVKLENDFQETGSGLVGELSSTMLESAFLEHLSRILGTPAIRHSALVQRPVRTVAICGGAGSFLISKALAAGADAFITADLKYHEFFEADGRLLLVDAGHFETEQFTIDLLAQYLQDNFPNFAVLKTGVTTNPVHYFLSSGNTTS